MPLGRGSIRFALHVAGVCLTLALSCASNPWPDEPGVPVALGLAANVDAGDSFLTELTKATGNAGSRSFSYGALPTMPTTVKRWSPFANEIPTGG